MVKKKLLIIGGSSGIGSYLIQKLNSEYNIFATYNKNSFRYENIKTFKLNLTMESNLIHNELSKLNIIPDALIYLPGGSLNFKKYEPKVICVEIHKTSGRNRKSQIENNPLYKFLKKKLTNIF